jgi:hypothetical protein
VASLCRLCHVWQVFNIWPVFSAEWMPILTR